MLPARIQLALPAWVHDAVDPALPCADDEAKVALAVRLSALNVAHGTGGPFGAAIFDALGRLVSVGVNQVVPQHCSAAHAEMMAFMLAQQRLQRFRLNEDGGRYTLASSAQPCCQCYGASVWAGIDPLLIGARAEDVMALTEFDEGPLPADWRGELERRGIAVRLDLGRESACEVLRRYGAEGGARY